MNTIAENDTAPSHEQRIEAIADLFRARPYYDDVKVVDNARGILKLTWTDHNEVENFRFFYIPKPEALP